MGPRIPAQFTTTSSRPNWLQKLRRIRPRDAPRTALQPTRPGGNERPNAPSPHSHHILPQSSHSWPVVEPRSPRAPEHPDSARLLGVKVYLILRMYVDIRAAGGDGRRGTLRSPGRSKACQQDQPRRPPRRTEREGVRGTGNSKWALIVALCGCILASLRLFYAPIRRLIPFYFSTHLPTL